MLTAPPPNKALRVAPRFLPTYLQRVARDPHGRAASQGRAARVAYHQGDQDEGVRAQRGEVVGLSRGDFRARGGTGGRGHRRGGLAGGQDDGSGGWCWGCWKEAVSIAKNTPPPFSNTRHREEDRKNSLSDLCASCWHTRSLRIHIYMSTYIDGI